MFTHKCENSYIQGYQGVPECYAQVAGEWVRRNSYRDAQRLIAAACRKLYPNALNVSYRRNGGMRFLKIGRLCLSWCVTREYRPLKQA